jgi:hypothetical protein
MYFPIATFIALSNGTFKEQGAVLEWGEIAARRADPRLLFSNVANG